MKFLIPCLSVLLLALGRPPLTQQPEGGASCGFALSGATAKATITGPEDITALVYVVEQPDSPLEILAIDFKDESFLSVANERETWRLRCTMKIRNRRDQWIRGASITILATSGGGGSGFVGPREQWVGLAPAQEEEVDACGGNGSGGAPGNHVRILMFVDRVETDDGFYKPSRRIPYQLGISPAGL